MKKSKNLYKLAKYFFVLLVLLVLSLSVIGSSSSSYVTTATQYGVGALNVPAILNKEVKLSFYYDSDSKNLPSSTGDYVYIESSYSSSSTSSGDKKYYGMKIENVNSATGMTDYFGTNVTDDNALQFADFFGVVKSDESYGTLTYTDPDSGDETLYTMPLVTETDVSDDPNAGDDTGNGKTTLNITPFKDKVTMTIYFTMRSVDKNGSTISDPLTAFYFNDKEIVYYNDSSNGTTSTGVTKCTNNVSGDYSFSPGSNTSSNKSIASHELYTYTATVDAETATNIMTATRSQTMIFLITLTTVTGLTLIDGSGNTSGSLNVGGEANLTASWTDSSNSYKATWTSSDSSVATVTEDANKNNEATVKAVGAGEATITVTVCGIRKTYSVYVKGVKVSGSGSVGVGNTTQLTATYYGDSGIVEDATISWSSSADSIATVDSSGIVKGVAKGSATITAEAKDSDNNVLGTATFNITVSSVTAINITELVNSGVISTSTYTEATSLYDDGVTTASLMASSGSTVSVDGSDKTIDGYTFNYRIKLGGSGSTEARSIKLDVADACTITVYAMSGKSGDTRTLALYNSSYTALDSTQSNNGNSIGKFTYTVDSSGTYYIASTSGGMNIYCVLIEYENEVVVKGDSSVTVGGETTLTATVNGSTSGVSTTWSSSDANIATVDSDGKVTGVAAGTATITASISYSGKTYTVTHDITVTSYAALSVGESGSGTASGSASLTTGSNTTLELTVSDSSLASGEAVTYIVSATYNSTMLTASFDGTAGVAEGDYTTITKEVTLTGGESGGASDTLELAIVALTTTGSSDITITVTKSGQTYTYASATYTVNVVDSTTTIVAIFTKSDTTLSSDAGFTITNGTYKSDDTSFEYDGTTYYNPLKMESSTSVTFTTTATTTLTLKITDGSGTIYIDGTKYTADSDGIVTITALSAGDHEITKDSTTNLCYVILESTT